MPGWLKFVAVLAVAAALGGGYLWFVDPELGRRVLRDTPLAPPPAITRAYKWRDAQGNWQLTDRPPPAGTPYETLEAHEGANVMPSARVSGEQPE